MVQVVEASADPFSDTPDAVPVLPERTRARLEPTCGLAGKHGLAKPPRKVDLSAVQRRWFEAGEWTYAPVQRFNAYGGVAHDLWGFADWIAVRGDETLLVQTTTHENASARERKARSKPELAAWLGGGGRRFVIHGWKQPGGPGTRWVCVEREVR